MDSTDAERGKRKATEPNAFVDLIKRCKRCKGSNVKFKFLNNKKENQPRYQCDDCTCELKKPYYFNAFPIREHNHENGYAKLPKVETEELKNLNKVCDHCQMVNNATFRGYNNGKANQPRYACKGCKLMFSPLKNSRAASTTSDASPYELQTPQAPYQETGASQQPSNYTGVLPFGVQTTGVPYQETGAFQQPSYTDVPSNEFQTIGVPYQELGAFQQLSYTDVPSYEVQTTGVPYQELGASQQPSYTDVPSYEVQTIGIPYQELGALQQPSYTDASSYEVQTTEAPYQETGALQQPIYYTDVPSHEFQTTQAPYQETGALQPPLSYEQTSISFQTYNSYGPYSQSSFDQSLTSMNVAGSSNQFPVQWENTAPTWLWPPERSEFEALCNQISASPQRDGYDFPSIQSSDIHSLVNVGVCGTSNQFAIPSQAAAEASQTSTFV